MFSTECQGSKMGVGLTSLKNSKFSMTTVYVRNEAKKADMASLCRASNLLYLHSKNHSLVSLSDLIS